jgi:hypothetical protein
MTRTSEPACLLQPIEHHIYVLRGQKVMLDEDLAALYGVSTKRFNEAAKRNLSRFPETFMLRLTREETARMRSQFATASKETLDINHLPLPSMAW